MGRCTGHARNSPLVSFFYSFSIRNAQTQYLNSTHYEADENDIHNYQFLLESEERSNRMNLKS